METYLLNDDITLYCLRATSFPEGIQAAHKQLHELIPHAENRQYFGISWPENGKIIYLAAAEASNLDNVVSPRLDTFVLPKGEYVQTVIQNFEHEPEGIDNAFKLLLTDPRIDPNGFCLEMYVGATDVRCMVKLK